MPPEEFWIENICTQISFFIFNEVLPTEEVLFFFFFHGESGPCVCSAAPGQAAGSQIKLWSCAAGGER